MTSRSAPKLRLDWVSASVARRRGPSIWLTAPLLVAAALVVIGAIYTWAVLAENAELHSQLAIQSAARVPKSATTVDSATQRVLVEQISAHNAVARSLNLPWDRLLEALRPEDEEDLIVVGLDTANGGSVIRVHGEAENAEAMTAYVEVLSNRPMFTRAVLIKHERNARFQDRYRFTVELAVAS